ncbi:MAG: LysR family transcriptional regulator, partial [Cypionkella sp.]
MGCFMQVISLKLAYDSTQQQCFHVRQAFMTDWRHMPPLSALRAFSAFAEASGLEEAGARIGVTHAAISQQIRALEAHLGLALVE